MNLATECLTNFVLCNVITKANKKYLNGWIGATLNNKVYCTTQQRSQKKQQTIFYERKIQMKGQLTEKYETNIIKQQQQHFQRSKPKTFSSYSCILLFLLLPWWHDVAQAKLSRKTYSVWDTTKSSNNNTKELVPDSDSSADDASTTNKGDLEQTLENFKRSIFIENRRRNKKSHDPIEHDAPVIYIPNIGKAYSCQIILMRNQFA